MSLWLSSGFLGTTHPDNVLRSHQPSVAATSLSLVECEYIFKGKCFYFVQLHVSKVILGTLA